MNHHRSLCRRVLLQSTAAVLLVLRILALLIEITLYHFFDGLSHVVPPKRTPATRSAVRRRPINPVLLECRNVQLKQKMIDNWVAASKVGV